MTESNRQPPCQWGRLSVPFALPASLVVGVLWLLASPAQAHHVADLGRLQPTPFNGLISGLAHPVLGPDHLLFLLALSLVALKQRLRWALGLLLVGLGGSAAGLIWPGLPGAEALVAATLGLEALVLLGRAPLPLLLPAMALHGYVLSGPVFGWSGMPVLAYGTGLFVSQASLLVAALLLLRPLGARLSPRMLGWIAIGLAACGGSWAIAALVG